MRHLGALVLARALGPPKAPGPPPEAPGARMALGSLKAPKALGSLEAVEPGKARMDQENPEALRGLKSLRVMQPLTALESLKAGETLKDAGDM